MKKIMAVFFASIVVLSLAGCNTGKPSDQVPSLEPSEMGNMSESSEMSEVQESYEINSMSDCLVEEDRKQFLILPISKEKIRILYEEAQYVNDIDFELLKAADKKISEELSQYSDHSGIHLEIYEGYLSLYAEVIVEINPPEDADEEDGGCGIDHEHKYFRERITK